MKPTIIVTHLILLSVFLLVGCGLPITINASPSDPLVMSPEEVVESFYNWYMQYPGNVQADEAYQDSIYLTENCITGINTSLLTFNQGGTDIFVCAQDIPDKLFIQPAVISSKWSMVTVKSSLDHEIKIHLLWVENEWKIDQINCP